MFLPIDFIGYYKSIRIACIFCRHIFAVRVGLCGSPKITYIRYSNDNCFAWAYLSNPNGGGIASFGATALGYIYLGQHAISGLIEGLAVNMFEAYKDGATTFGEMWSGGINEYISTRMESYDYKTLEEWQPFGDPTLAIAEESIAPNTPDAPEGPISGGINTEHTYTASTTDDDEYASVLSK